MVTGPMPRKPKADRKSTRLNSSHLGISYAVFCLKKKKRSIITTTSRQDPPPPYRVAPAGAGPAGAGDRARPRLAAGVGGDQARWRFFFFFSDAAPPEFHPLPPPGALPF